MTSSTHVASQACVDLIKRFEGLRLQSYLCPAGVWTIGYGTTRGVKAGMTITPQQAEAMLRRDLAGFEAAVNDAVSTSITQGNFDGLVAWTYNVGETAMRSSTLLRLVNSRQIAAAALQFARWNKAGGKVLAGLVRRREAERVLFLS